jgi:hypothetical protein
MKFFLPLLLSMFLLGGCVKDKYVAPTPPEAGLIAWQVMSLGLSTQNVPVHKADIIEDIMIDAKTVLVHMLKQEVVDMEAARIEVLHRYAPEYAMLADTVLQVLVYRLRPLIDQGKTDLAISYVEAVIDGALGAIDQYQLKEMS